MLGDFSNSRLQAACWSLQELPDALRALLGAAGFGSVDASERALIDSRQHALEVLPWLAKGSNCDAEPIQIPLETLSSKLPGMCPALLLTASGDSVAVLNAQGERAELVGRDGKLQSVRVPALADLVRMPEDEERRAKFAQFLESAGLQGAGRHLQKLLLISSDSRPEQIGWTLRPRAARGVLQFLTQAAAWRNGAVLLSAHVLEYGLWLLSWWMLGQMSLAGRMDRGLLMAWALLLLTIVPLRVLGTYAQGVLAVSIGAALKRRLLLGTLRLPVDEIRQRGTGSVLAQVFESQAVETLALSGGIAGCLSVVELGAAALLLGPLSLLLACVCILLVLAGRRFWGRYQEWTSTRLRMTDDLIQAMVGHRTRLVQQPAEHAHLEEDQNLEQYALQAKKVDSQGAWLVAAIPRCWLVGALACLTPGAVSGMDPNSTLAVRMGGVLLAYTALRKLTGAAVEIAGTLVAARRIAPLFQAAQTPELVSALPPAPESVELDPKTSKVMELQRVQFRYASASKTAIRSANLTVRSGERWLVEGPSGGGKSTLAALISGLRNPQSGVLLAGGLDRFTWGESGWRKQVANAPQFHDNHILTETLAFNLLMGRTWPPRGRDLEEAEAMCREVGLGDLIDRMPSGLSQMVGEGGWQLSQGERSRVFLARALLQGAKLTILDESFGALDPENLQSAMECTLDRTDALMVIAHP